MHWKKHLAIGLVCTWVVLAQKAVSQPASVQPASPETERIFTEAQRILANTKETTYSHTTQVDESKGKYDLDCTGLCRYILQRVLSAHLAAIVKWGGRDAPRAVEFCDFFQSRPKEGDDGSGWICVERLMDARPGDMLTYRRDHWNPGENTGHAMILAAEPAAEKDGLVRVEVIDSSSMPPGDPKRAAGSTGVATRTHWFKVNNQGVAVGFGLTEDKVHEAITAIGRAVAIKGP